MSRPLTAAWASLALIACLTGGPAAAVEAVTGTQLVMHVGPGAHHPSRGDIPAETRLTVHGCTEAEGWCLVRFAGRHGWIEGESLNVVGFSRPPQPVTAVVAPAEPEPTLVPAPVAPEALLPPFVTADDVIVGIGEQFGFAAIAPRAGGKVVDLKKRHRGGVVFKRHGFKADIRDRRHGRFHQPHLDRRGFPFGSEIRFAKRGTRLGKGFHFDRLRFGKHGHFVVRGKSADHKIKFGKVFHFDGARFGKRGHFIARGKGAGDGLKFGKDHVKQRFGKPGKSFGRSGKLGFTGLRVKGGWRP